MTTKVELEQEIADLSTALEEARDLIDQALGPEDEDQPESDGADED